MGLIFQSIVFAGSGIALGAYMCRVLMLDPRLHTWPPIFMHGGLSIAMGWDMVAAWQGMAGPGHVAALVGAAAWIVISYPSWRFGVPDHYLKMPPIHWPNVETDP